MITFTQSRRDWNDLEFAQRMLRAGSDGYKSVYHELDFDDYVLLSTATSKQLKENYTESDLQFIFEELETIGEKQSKEVKVSSGEIVMLYWEIDRFSGYERSGHKE